MRFLAQTLPVYRLGWAVAVLIALASACSSQSWAESTPRSSFPVEGSLTRPVPKEYRPKLFKLSDREAGTIAGRYGKVKNYLERFGSHRRKVSVKGQGKWQVSYFVGGDEVAKVVVDDSMEVVEEAWVGPQVAWSMARGVEGAFGRKVNKPWVWVPLMLAFILPFVQIRRPFSLLNLDLIVLLSFSISLYYFNQGEVFTSVPLAYPPLIYLMLRMLQIGFRGVKSRSGHLPRLLVPSAWLALGLIFLIGFRIVLNLLDSNVIDVGYSGVIGADKLSSGNSPYGDFPADNSSGDTYGPFAYLAYVPFELLFPWHGAWDSLPAAHAASIFFDLTMMLGLYLVGAKLQGIKDRVRQMSDLGIVLAYGWAAFPFTLYVMNSNSNDTLMPLLLVFGFVALKSAPARSALLALASLTKFAAAALVPLWFLYRSPQDFGRYRLKFALAFTLVSVVLLAPVIIDPGLSEFWERTVGFQLGRESPFSIWGLHPVRYGAYQDILKIAVAALAVVVAFLPRYKDAVQLAALTAAVLISTQLVIDHWFYLYIVWFFPFVLIALVGRLNEATQLLKEKNEKHPVGQPVNPPAS